MKKTLNKSYYLFILACLFGSYITEIHAQQDPQYTHYMYNTISVNPAYAGSRGHATIQALGRTQWVGFKGAPDSQTLSFDTPLGKNVGLGINFDNDFLGPAHEMYLSVPVSYTLKTSENSNLAFGLNLGGRLLNVDFSKGQYKEQADESFQNINNKFLPTFGAGVYFYKPTWYVGLSIPNFLQRDHYQSDLNAGKLKIAEEELHLFLIAGMVFDLSDDIKFKPAALLKAVKGAPLIVDVSANFLFFEKFRAGLAWRWDDSVAGLLGFQATKNLLLGYSYDLTTTNYRVTNQGTHEIMLRYEFLNERITMKSPRFF